MAELVDFGGEAGSNLVSGAGTTSVTFTMPRNIGIKVESVVATINNATGAATGAILTISDQSGEVVAKRRQSSNIDAAANPATATWALRLDDDVTGTSTQTVSSLILATGPAGFWKLNEPSGVVAADSSGNGHHMTPPGGFGPPTWGATAIITGDTSAYWPIAPATEPREQVTMPLAYTDNFTAGIWCFAPSGFGAIQGECIGQGTSRHVSGASTGWQLYFSTAVGSAVYFDNGTSISADAVQALDTKYFLAVVRDAGTWKMYINGVQQTATSGVSPGVGSTDTWIGSDGYPLHGSYAQGLRLAYGFVTPSVVSASDLLAIYNAGL